LRLAARRIEVSGNHFTAAASYPKGATLFVEGQKPRGVFILCNGRVKLSTSSADGRR
jgi:CRP-like cAMP-binding protein